jgi:hypothetical protein
MVARVAMISAGCGGTRSSGGTNTASPHAKAVKFAECMRANGVSAFPDPDATGALTIDAVANGSSLDWCSARPPGEPSSHRSRVLRCCLVFVDQPAEQVTACRSRRELDQLN